MASSRAGAYCASAYLAWRVGGPGWLIPMRAGGSGAALVRHVGPRRSSVIKIVQRQADVVDGHEAEALFAKGLQASHVRAASASLARMTPAQETVALGDFVVAITPFVRGTRLIDILARGDDVGFARGLAATLDAIGLAGYGLASRPVDDPRAAYGARLARRLEYLADAGFGDAWLNGCLGVEFGARGLLQLADDVAMQRRTLPSREFFPVHGDLNLFNVVVAEATGEVTLVDPRGTTSPIDPVYDLGKMLLSLWIQGPVETRASRWPEPGIAARRPQLLKRFDEGVSALRSALGRWDFATQLEPSSDQLWTRVQYAAALHAICEAACRVSVARRLAGLRATREITKAKSYLMSGALLLQSLGVEEHPPMTRVGPMFSGPVRGE